MFGKRYEPQLKLLLEDVVRVAVNRKLRSNCGLGAFKSCLKLDLPSYHMDLRMLDEDTNDTKRTLYGSDLIKPEKKKDENVPENVKASLKKVIVLGKEIRIWKGGDEFRAEVSEIDQDRNVVFLKYLDDEEEMVCDEDEWVRMDSELLDRLIL
jgi:hypothetical protein